MPPYKLGTNSGNPKSIKSCIKAAKSSSNEGINQVAHSRAIGKNPKEDCHKMIQFLWSGYGRNIVTSDAGMYGELREGSLRQIFSYLSKDCMLNEMSVLCDIGSGRGCPNIVATYETKLGASIGIELGKLAHILAQKNKLVILEREMTDMISKNEDPNFHAPKHKLSFINMDAAYIQSLEPVTHIFSFDAAMPGWLIFHLCKLFNQSKTTFCYCSFRSNLIEEYWLKGFKKKVLHGNMSGSGEGRSCHIYLKNEWESLSTKAYTHINWLFNHKCGLSSSENSNSENISNFERYTDPSNLAEALEIALLPAALQQTLTNQQIEDWYSNKILRSSLQENTNQIKKAQLEREAFLIQQTESCDPLDNPFLTAEQYWEKHDDILKTEVQRAWKQIGAIYAEEGWILPDKEPPPSFFINKKGDSWLNYFEGHPLPNLPKQNPIKDLLLKQDWKDIANSVNNILDYFNDEYQLDEKLDSKSCSNELKSTNQFLNWHPMQSYWKWSIKGEYPEPYKPYDENNNLNNLFDNQVSEIINQAKKVYMFNRIKKFLPIQWEAKQISRCLTSTIWWVQCDKCEKWRKIPNSFPSAEREMIQKNAWECKMNFWDSSTPHKYPCEISCDWTTYQGLYAEI